MRFRYSAQLWDPLTLEQTDIIEVANFADGADVILLDRRFGQVTLRRLDGSNRRPVWALPLAPDSMGEFLKTAEDRDQWRRLLRQWSVSYRYPPEFIERNFTLPDYISLIMTMILGMGIVFQLPLVMIFLSRTGIVTTTHFRRYRKISIFSAVVLGRRFRPSNRC